MPPAEPFGYYKNEQGQKQPIQDQLDALERVKFYLKQGCTMQAVRDWLVKKTGRNISVPGMLKSIKYDNTLRSYYFWLW